jgi:Zn-dependent M28 family amino/carboxypeptidase
MGIFLFSRQKSGRKYSAHSHNPYEKPKIVKSIILTTLILTTTIYISCAITKLINNHPGQFNGERAFLDAAYQLSLGPRVLGSTAHQKVRSWIISELKAAGWVVENQDANWKGYPIHNIVAKRGNGNQWVILGAHYDSRLVSDRDPDPTLRNQPVPGANDGASGVAVLLELARCLPRNLDKTIWLVFFDAEDNGNLAGNEWIIGSQAFVGNLSEKPDQAIIIDMIGDIDLNIYKEKNSNYEITESIWGVADRLGYEEFILEPKYRILDDHIPFLEAGIPAVDIIDFDYPFWHTTQDTLDKISAQSLQVVGYTLCVWLMEINY